MPTRGLTRLQLRQDIATEMIPFGAYVSTASEAGAAGGTTLVDNTLPMGAASDNAQKGRWLEITDGAVAGDIRQVTSSSVASNATTFTFPATTGATQVASGVGYILWPMWMPVTMVNRLINNAIKSLDGAFYDRVEYLGFHGDGLTYRFDIPTTLTMLTALSRRYAYDSKDIHLCDSVWTTDI